MHNKKEAIDCCDLAYKLGWEWEDGSQYSDFTNWDEYGCNTCYNFYEGTYCDMEDLTYIKNANWF